MYLNQVARKYLFAPLAATLFLLASCAPGASRHRHPGRADCHQTRRASTMPVQSWLWCPGREVRAAAPGRGTAPVQRLLILLLLLVLLTHVAFVVAVDVVASWLLSLLFQGARPRNPCGTRLTGTRKTLPSSLFLVDPPGSEVHLAIRERASDVAAGEGMAAPWFQGTPVSN